MTLALGTVPANSTIYIPFATYGKTNGESITLTGLAVTDIEIYKNGSVTQRSSDAGFTLLDTDGIDFDGVTGIHGFSIDLSDNTDAGFYAVGSWYWVVVSSVTIDGQTVNFVAAVFRIGPAEGIAGYPKVDVHAFAGTAATATGGRPEVNVSHVGGAAENISTRLDAAVSSRLAAASYSAPLDAAATRAAVGLASANLDTQLAAIDDYVDAEVSAIKAVTDNLPDGGALTSLATAASIAALNDLSAAEVNAEIVDALTVDTYGEPASVPAATASLKDKLGWLFTLARNRLTQTTATLTVRNDANSADIATATVSDDGTTTVRGKLT